MRDEILRLKPAQVVELVKQGEMEVVTTAPAVINESSLPQDGMIERAREILGQDFLGVEAIREMESKLKIIGIDVKFDVQDAPPIKYSEKDLELAHQNGEMLVLRASQMVKEETDDDEPIASLGRRDPQLLPVTLINFRELFRNDPNQKLFYSFRPEAYDWYLSEDFATKNGEIKLEWALVKKDILEGTTSKKWGQQDGVLKEYGKKLKQQGAINTEIRHRTATEAAWDTMLYYANTGEHLLEKTYDWTGSRTSDGLVDVGAFDSSGLNVNGWDPGNSSSDVGVCPSR